MALVGRVQKLNRALQPRLRDNVLREEHLNEPSVG